MGRGSSKAGGKGGGAQRETGPKTPSVIEADKNYVVLRYDSSVNGKTMDYGTLPGSDVKSMLKGYTFDENFKMWFSQRARYGFSVVEV